MGQLGLFDADNRLTALSARAIRLRPSIGWCHGKAFAATLRLQC